LLSQKKKKAHISQQVVVDKVVIFCKQLFLYFHEKWFYIKQNVFFVKSAVFVFCINQKTTNVNEILVLYSFLKIFVCFSNERKKNKN